MLCCITTAIEMLSVYRVGWCIQGGLYRNVPSGLDSTNSALHSLSNLRTMSIVSSHCLNNRDTVPWEGGGGGGGGGGG